MTPTRFLIFVCVLFLKSMAAEPTELLFLRDGVYVEFRLISGTSVDKDMLRVSIFDSMVIVQGLVAAKRDIPSDRGNFLIRAGQDICSLQKPIIEKGGELSIMLNSRVAGLENKFWVEQKDVRKTEEIGRVIKYLKQVETAVGLKKCELVNAAEDIFHRAQQRKH